MSRRKVKEGRFKEDTDSTNGVRPSQEAREAPGHGAGSFIGLVNFIGQCVGGVLKLFWGRGRDFQELDHHPLFDPLWSALELSWQLRVCHLADVLEAVYKDAQELLEVNSLSILDLVVSNQFMSSPQWLSFF